jgi:hypothetical protein
VDPLKKALAERVKGSVRQMAGEMKESGGISGREATVEFQDITPLLSRIRVYDGTSRGPRYFDVVFKESII